MRVWTRISVYIGILLLFVCITACGKTDEVQMEDDATAESQAEEIPTQTEDSDAELPEKDEAQDEIVMDMDNNEQIEEESGESEDMTQPQQKYTYRGDAVLSEDDIESTIKYFLQISNSSLFYRLEKLPLTETFFYECIEHPENFPYVDIEDIEKMKQFDLVFWGIREDGKCVGLCKFQKSNSVYNTQSSFYYIVMDLEDGQIDSMEVTLVKENATY